MNGSRSACETPAKARRTGKPSPSKPRGEVVIERDWYELGSYELDGQGRCERCRTQCPGVFDGPPQAWGRKRIPVRLIGADG